MFDEATRLRSPWSPACDRAGRWLSLQRADEIKPKFVIELGSSAWRVELFEGWQGLAGMVRSMVPSAWWWLWGCFVSNHPVPLFGDRELIGAVVVLPLLDVPVQREHGEMLLCCLI
jgi:hypothetical protein